MRGNVSDAGKRKFKNKRLRTAKSRTEHERERRIARKALAQVDRNRDQRKRDNDTMK